MIYELLYKQSEDELSSLMPLICGFKTSLNVSCRYQMLLILISVYDMIQIKSTASLNSNMNKIKNMTNDALLTSLLDEDPTIRLMAQNFWTEKARMPSSTIDRMVLILGKYDSEEHRNRFFIYFALNKSIR